MPKYLSYEIVQVTGKLKIIPKLGQHYSTIPSALDAITNIFGPTVWQDSSFCIIPSFHKPNLDCTNGVITYKSWR